MQQRRQPANSQRNSSGRRKKAQRKRQARLRLIFFSSLTFLLGLLLGMLIASDSSEAQSGISILPPPPKQDEAEEEVELPWNLQLVNFENILAEDFEPEEMKELPNGTKIDSRIFEAAEKMLKAARADGVRVLPLSGYRSFERQDELYKDKIRRVQKEFGFSVTKAREEAGKEVAPPGTSEHQLGLALDLSDVSYTGLDAKQEQTAAYKWLSRHCHEYGFIVRYPAGKTEITGIIYEPWHFRYVGLEAAAEIMEEGITLEEYVEKNYF